MSRSYFATLTSYGRMNGKVPDLVKAGLGKPGKGFGRWVTLLLRYLCIVRANLLGQHVKMERKNPVITQLGKPTKETYCFATEMLREVCDESGVQLRVGSSEDLGKFGRSLSNVYARLIQTLIHTNELTAT